MRFDFHVGKPRPSTAKWVTYSVATAASIALITHFGNLALSSSHGAFLRDVICSISKILPDGSLARWMATACRASGDGRITEDEAKQVLDRAAKSVGVAPHMFDNDRSNTDLRARDEVDYAVERWERANPSPKVDPALRRQLPQLTDVQLCVLSQAERYEDKGAIGIRYAGMSVCEETR